MATNDDDLARFKRFLNTGKETAEPYEKQFRVFTVSLNSVFNLIKSNRGVDVINTIRSFVETSAVYNHEPLLYALAVCCRSNDSATKQSAYSLLNTVCKLPMELFNFVRIYESVNLTTSESAEAKTDERPKSTHIFVTDLPDREATTEPFRPVSARRTSAGIIKPLLLSRQGSSKSHASHTQQSSQQASVFLQLTELSPRQPSAKTQTEKIDAVTVNTINSARLSTFRPTSSRSQKSIDLNKVPHLPPIDLSLKLDDDKVGDLATDELRKEMILERITSARIVAERAVLQQTSNDPTRSEMIGSARVRDRPISGSRDNRLLMNRLKSARHPLDNQINERDEALKAIGDMEKKLVETNPIAAPRKPSARLPPLEGAIIETKGLLRGTEADSVATIVKAEASTAAATHTRQSSARSAATNTAAQEPQNSSVLQAIPALILSVPIVPLPKSVQAAVVEQNNIVKPSSTGWGRSHRRAIGLWYTSKKPSYLVQLITKHRAHNKWTHRDLLRLAHPKTNSLALNIIFKYIVKGFSDTKAYYASLHSDKPNSVHVPTDNAANPAETKVEPSESSASAVSTAAVVIVDSDAEYVYSFLDAFEKLKRTTDEADACKLIEIHKFELEHLPLRFAKSVNVLRKLIQNTSIETITRRLGYLADLGVFHDTDQQEPVVEGTLKIDYSQLICEKLKNNQQAQFVDLLTAWKAYERGKTLRHGRTWFVDSNIAEAFDAGFNGLLTSVPQTNKKLCVVFNVQKKGKLPFVSHSRLNNFEAAAAMCTTHIKSAPQTTCVFTFTEKLQSVSFDLNSNYSEIYKALLNTHTIGSETYLTAIDEALHNSLEFDALIIYTSLQDTSSNDASSLLAKYSQALNRPHTKLIIVSMLPNVKQVFESIKSNNLLEINGFDKNVPHIIQNFLNDKF